MNHLIKVSFTDGNEIVTRINGTADDVIDHYKRNNMFALNSGSPQATRIEFVESPILEAVTAFIYLFIDYDNSGLLA